SPIVAANCAFRAERNWERENARLRGGGGGIRTPETLSGLTVFKTAGFNHSPTPPLQSLTGNGQWFQMIRSKETDSSANETLEPATFQLNRSLKIYLWMNFRIRTLLRDHRNHSDGRSDDFARYHQFHAAILLTSIRSVV